MKKENATIHRTQKLRRAGIPATPFHWSRNPIFLGLVLILIAICCADARSIPASSALREPKLSPSPPPAAGQPCLWTGIDKIVAVGDLHGDYASFRLILGPKGTGLIDEKDQWVGGKTHLVQTGDIMDRGDFAKDIFDLIRRLEKEASAAGGMVHFLVGNHEEMNILGLSFRYGYVTPEQFRSFLPADYVAAKEAKFKAKAENGGDLTKLWGDLRNDSDAQSLYTRTFNADYGTWISEHNAVIKINDTVFLHAGFSESFSTWKLETINSVLTRELKKIMNDVEYGRQPSLRGTRIVYQPQGPLWHRDLVSKDEALMEEEFSRILANLGAKSMVVAHTPTQSAVSMEYMNRFGKRLFMIDTSISSFMGMESHPSALIIEKGEFRVWPPEDRAAHSGRDARDAHPSAGRKVNHEKDRSGDDVFVDHHVFWEGHPPF
ncbi:MAG: metallophosphoesterase [Candidatus Aminicenantes bacterium]|nr:metallophosphoesterase [Candidatus Aminicenantes bacterium]